MKKGEIEVIYKKKKKHTGVFHTHTHLVKCFGVGEVSDRCVVCRKPRKCVGHLQRRVPVQL